MTKLNPFLRFFTLVKVLDWPVTTLLQSKEYFKYYTIEYYYDRSTQKHSVIFRLTAKR